MAEKSKEETVPASTLTWRIQRLALTRSGIQVVQEAGGVATETNLYEGQDLAELAVMDVGTLLGLGPKGMTLKKLVEDLAIAIMVDRGDEVASDWT